MADAPPRQRDPVDRKRTARGGTESILVRPASVGLDAEFEFDGRWHDDGQVSSLDQRQVRGPEGLPVERRHFHFGSVSGRVHVDDGVVVVDLGIVPVGELKRHPSPGIGEGVLDAGDPIVSVPLTAGEAHRIGFIRKDPAPEGIRAPQPRRRPRADSSRPPGV